ncbi:DUF1971 domain-containing protein [Thalassobaculum sp.]|uniref:DUF1971 domain-containing protein n=1 Tax=Thalassobaculum sp. TaxID=2022740 RepID=UPI0032EF9F52
MNPPANLRPYRRTPLFTEATAPAGLLADHSTREGVWGKLHVETGQLTYIVADTGVATVLQAGQQAVIRPGERHRVSLDVPVTFFIEFLREENPDG